MGTTTPRLSLYKPLTDGSELVNVATDIDQNMDKIDLAVGFQSCTSSTRPSTPYSGKAITQSDTAYSTYFSNGTAPASGSWLEIPNSSSTFASNLKLSASSQLVLGVDTNLFRNAANVLRTNDALIVDGALTASSTLAVTSNVTVGGDLKLVNGATTLRNQLTAPGVTVANSITETIVGTMTIPAADAVVGATYRARMIANVSFLASAVLTWRARIGGLAGTALVTAGPTTLHGTAQTNKESIVDVDLVCVSTGASGTWFAMLSELRNTQDSASIGGATGTVGGGVQLGSTDGTIVQNTTIANDFVITAMWGGTASASNTLTARCIFYRIA